ncbi:MAG: hypothetical protein ACRC6M_19575, partial [Microcystaceae cyanobacterium]
LTLKVYKGNSVRVSWIERSHSVSSAPYCQNITNYIDCWNRRVKVYFAPDDSDLEFKIDSTGFLLNSVVIEGDGLFVGITDQQKRLVLYDFLSQTLTNITNQLKLSQCYVLTGVTATVNTTVANGEFIRQFPIYTENYGWGSCPSIVGENIVFSAPVFQSVPSSYYFVYLESGGSKSGREPSMRFGSDSFSIQLSRVIPSHFEVWRDELREKQPAGYEITNPLDPYGLPAYNAPSFMELTYPIPIYDELIIFRTVANNYWKQTDWRPIHSTATIENLTPTTYPCLDRNSLNFAYVRGYAPYDTIFTDTHLKIPSNSEKKGYLFQFYMKSDPKLQRGVLYSPYDDSYNTRPQFRKFVGGGNVNRLNVYMKVRYPFVAIPFIGEDYDLFSSSQVGLIKNSIDQKVSYSYDDNGQYTTVVLNEITSKQGVKVSVENLDIENPVISHEIVSNEATVTFTKTNTGSDVSQVWVNFSQRNYYNYTLVTQSVNLNRSLRIPRLESANLRVNGSVKTVLSDSETIALIESFNFDPNEDERDIMPVPKMLEEIHAALQADKYSTDPSTGSPRTWNLGMMLHALTMANGLNIAPDGKPRNPEDYVVYQDGDAVSDRYGQGQAGIEYKQLDGELTPCPGYLYDVQTPKLQKNPFTGEISDLGTGGMLGCSNVLQAKAAFERDLGKAFGIDQSVGVIPSADGGYTTY